MAQLHLPYCNSSASFALIAGFSERLRHAWAMERELLFTPSGASAVEKSRAGCKEACIFHCVHLGRVQFMAVCKLVVKMQIDFISDLQEHNMDSTKFGTTAWSHFPRHSQAPPMSVPSSVPPAHLPESVFLGLGHSTPGSSC